MTAAWVPALFAALAVLLWTRSEGGARLREVLGERGAVPGAAVPGRTRLACALGGAAVVTVLGGALGLGLGVLVALAGPPLLVRLESSADRRAREEVEDALPTALDLLAACLVGGSPLLDAVAAVGQATGGVLGKRLDRVAAELRLGAAPEVAWTALSGSDQDAAGAAVVRALVRASASGAPVAATVSRLAADARTARRDRATQRARQAGVLAVLPLGLCFLPAFVLLGVVPVLVGLAGPLLAAL